MRSRILPLAIVLALMGSLTIPNTADAIPARLKARIAQAKDDVKTSKKLMKDDKKDLRSIERLARKWLDAADERNDSKMAKLDEDLLEWLREELRETRQDRARARAELEATGAEVEPQQTRRPRNARDRRSPDNAAQADARSDFEAEREDMQATREIAESLRDLQREFESGSAGAAERREKADLLRDLVRGARRDLRRSTRELAEDEERLDELKARR